MSFNYTTNLRGIYNQIMLELFPELMVRLIMVAVIFNCVKVIFSGCMKSVPLKPTQDTVNMFH